MAHLIFCWRNVGELVEHSSGTALSCLYIFTTQQSVHMPRGPGKWNDNSSRGLWTHMVKPARLKTPTFFKKCCVSPCGQNHKMDLGFVYEAMQKSQCAAQYDIWNWHELLIASDWERIALDYSIIEVLFICLHLT